MKKNLQATLLIFILAGAAFLGFRFPAFHPERSQPIFGTTYSKGDTVKIDNETPGAVKR